MRARLIFIVVAVLVVAAFAALNWPEFTRASPLSVGVASFAAPLGVVMLVLMGIVLAVFLVSAATQESRHLLEHRRHSRALQAQRELAEKAESSRFTDLRQQLDTHLRESRQREAITSTEFEKSLMQSHRELRAQLDNMAHMLSTRLSELEGRLPARVERVEETRPAGDVPPRDRVRM
jgi:uncharacterized integral membrane protein